MGCVEKRITNGLRPNVYNNQTESKNSSESLIAPKKSQITIRRLLLRACDTKKIARCWRKNDALVTSMCTTNMCAIGKNCTAFSAIKATTTNATTGAYKIVIPVVVNEQDINVEKKSKFLCFCCVGNGNNHDNTYLGLGYTAKNLCNGAEIET